MTNSSIYTNPFAKDYHHTYTTDVSQAQTFHHRLPNFHSTPLIPLPDLAKDLGVHAIYIKDESSRLGLPAFKILGASWGTFRAIAATATPNLPLDTTLHDLSTTAQALKITLFAATEGNHGRAVARMGKLLSIPARIYVPRYTYPATQDKIRTEGAEVMIVQGNYDDAVAEANRACQATEGGLLIQDNAFEGYEEIPMWIVEGYSTLMQEVEQHLDMLNLKATVMVTPIGVGSLGHAVVAHCKSEGRGITTLTVEPDTAACLHENLKTGELKTVKVSETIMAGMQCGTVSPISWPVLKAGWTPVSQCQI